MSRSVVQVSFGSIVMRLDFLVIALVPYDLIIGAPTLVEMRACTDICHQTFNIKNHGKAEALILDMNPKNGMDHTVKLELNRKVISVMIRIKEIIVHCINLREEYAADIKWLFQVYPDVIAHSFDDVRPSRCEVARNFELTSKELISKRLRRLPPAYISKQISSLKLNHLGILQLYWQRRNMKTQDFALAFKVKLCDEERQMTCCKCRRNFKRLNS